MNIHRSIGFRAGALGLTLPLAFLTPVYAGKTSPKTTASKPAASSAKPAGAQSAPPRPAAAAAKPAAAKAATPTPKPPPMVTLHTDFELQLGGEVMMRTALPPLKYSDKGLIQHYTRADLIKLKGDYPELPGFPSKQLI